MHSDSDYLSQTAIFSFILSYTHILYAITDTHSQKNVWSLHLFLSENASKLSPYHSLQMHDWWVYHSGVMLLVCVCVCVCVWLCLAVPKAFHVLVAGHLEVSGWSAGRVEALIECLGTHHWTWGHGQRTLSISTKTMLPFPVNVKALFVLAHSLCVCVYVCVCAQVLWMAGWRSFYQWVSARPSTLPVFDVKTNGTANLLLCVLW